ncbi:MAG TPA: NAD(P)-dependent oxidoreductase [Ilumatobacteraceae bacterium]|nr:NAD(P)-dependent oxidoreductase [Ilumatobacteraceae bacterium]
MNARLAPDLTGRCVFVTGANGFLGRAVMTRCAALGAQVRGLDMQADADRGVVAGDITDPASWADHLAGCDIVVHTAAVVTNNVDPALAWSVNVIGTRRVVDAAAAAGVSRVMYISTMGAARFAQIETEAVERYFPGEPFDEQWPLMPVGNPYTDTKIAAEHYVLAAHAAGRVGCTVIRPADIYGPGCRPWVLEPLNAIRNGKFLLPNHGKGLFTAIYVDDIVDGILAAATTDAAAGRIVHLGGEAPITTAEYFGHFYRMLGKQGPPKSYSTRTAVAIAEFGKLLFRLRGKHTELGRGVMQMLNKSRPVSNALAHELLGWWPKVDLVEGMHRTEEWLRAEGLLP